MKHPPASPAPRDPIPPPTWRALTVEDRTFSPPCSAWECDQPATHCQTVRFAVNGQAKLSIGFYYFCAQHSEMAQKTGRPSWESPIGVPPASAVSEREQHVLIAVHTLAILRQKLRSIATIVQDGHLPPGIRFATVVELCNEAAAQLPREEQP